MGFVPSVPVLAPRFSAESASDLARVRQYTHTGRPLGSQEFVADLERMTERALAARKVGRPEEKMRGAKQDGFIFAA